MAFDSYGNSENSSGKKSDIDFDALNAYVIETANLQESEVLSGIVSSIIDLGLQEQEDAAVEFKGTAEDEAEAIEKYPDTYFEDGPNPDPSKSGIVRLKRWPQKPVQSVVVAVDFPDIQLDKGQFFGDDSGTTKPLRMYLGGQFFIPDVGMIVGRPTPLKETKNPEGQWSFSKNHLFYKMAQAAKLVDPAKNDVFKPRDIDKLLGRAFNFEVKIFMKPGKGGKEYYTEQIKYMSALTRNQKEPDASEVNLSLIQFNQVNSEEDLKEIRWHVKNTMKRASNFPGSKIEAQLNALGNSGNQEGSQESDADDAPVQEKKKADKPKAAPKKRAVVPPTDDDLDGDIPF